MFSGECCRFKVMRSPTSLFKRWVKSPNVFLTSKLSRRSVCLREKAKSWATKAAALFAFWLIWLRSAKSWSAWSCRNKSKSQCPEIAVKRLLKSCAIPPASWPIACIFWLWTNCAPWVFNSVASLNTAISTGWPPSKLRESETWTYFSCSDLFSCKKFGWFRPRPLCASKSQSEIGRPSPSKRFCNIRPSKLATESSLSAWALAFRIRPSTDTFNIGTKSASNSMSIARALSS